MCVVYFLRLFGSAGSDYSDCELCDERRRRTRHRLVALYLLGN